MSTSKTAALSLRESAPSEHRRVRAILAGLMLGMILGALDVPIIAPALPIIVGDLGRRE